jgi:chromosome segregation ATPase
MEGQVAAKTAVGQSSLRRVDFEQQRIERSQAEAELARASAGTIALKAQVVAAQQSLADQRAELAAASAATEQLSRKIGMREGQAEQLRADVSKLQQECLSIKQECLHLRAQGTGQATAASSGGSTWEDSEADTAAALGPVAELPTAEAEVTILDYIRVKNACAEAGKKIADWQRRLEIRAGQPRVGQR